MRIKTTDLMIRTFEASDLELFKQLLTIPELPGWQKQWNRSKEFLDWQISNYKEMDVINGTVCLGIFDQNKSKLLGAVGAGKHDDLEETEIFYHLLPSTRGRGYATEAAKAMTHWVLNHYNLEYIIGTVGIDNIASQKVLEKCGFVFIEKKCLLVHITGNSHHFKYYRKYREKA